MQVKLLRVIQERRVRRVGDTQEQAVDVRIISATHQSLKEAVDAGRFRQDLFYRLNVIEMHMPALRERREDIPELAHSILQRLAHDSGMNLPKLTPVAVKALERYAFPGNVRELENILERALALSSGDDIDEADLRLEPVPLSTGELSASGASEGGNLQDHLDRFEKLAIVEALGKTGGNRTRAAQLLGVTFRSLRYRMERLGMKEQQ
jgi:two-component system response regulator PilR (NtrC family)